MRPYPDPLRVYADAVRAGDHRLARLIAERLFPWVRRPVAREEAPIAARRTVERLRQRLGL